MKRTPLRRNAALARKKPINPVNRERKKREYARCYGSKERVERIRALGCAVCGKAPSDNAHVRSRGAGGTWRDVVPLCPDHHSEQHRVGWDTFRARYPRDYEALAERLAEEMT